MKNKKNIASLALLIVVVALTVGLVAWHASKSKPAPLPAATARPTPKVIIEEREVEKLVEVEVVHEVTSEELSHALNDVGLLVTQEYYFTGVTGGSNKLKFLGRAWDFTESSFLISYDGVVTAGVDFSRIKVEKYDRAGTILVTMPAAVILGVDIDPESFRLHYEKNSIFTEQSVVTYNDSVIALEQEEKEKALERGILEKADENARKLIRSMVLGLVDPTVYSVYFNVGG